MRTMIYFVIAAIGVLAIAWGRRRAPVRAYNSVDVVVPAYNEAVCIEQSISGLMQNPYFNRIIVVNDGSTDGTGAVLDRLATHYPRLDVIHQENTGKGGALMAGIRQARSPFVFLTDADTTVPAEGDGVGYMLAEMEAGADAVGGIPLSDLKGAGFLPHIRASTKLIVISVLRTFQQVLGGAPFLISGACGLFKRHVLLDAPFSDRTKVEDLDATWTLIGRGYKVRQCSRSFVYSQECNSLKAEWLRWRRWISGYAICMRLHPRLLLTRYGLLTVIPVALSSVVAFGFLAYSLAPVIARGDLVHLPLSIFPWQWMLVIYAIGAVGAIHHRRASLVLLAPAALVYVLICYFAWMIHGLTSLISGREPQRDKPQRYAHVVD